MKRGQFNKTFPDHHDFGAHRKPYGVSSFNRLVRQYKANAAKRGLLFALTDVDMQLLTSSDCKYCGRKPSQVMTSADAHGEYIYNGIDRRNPLLGYSVQNCVPACKYCNQAKSNMSESEWRLYREALSKTLEDDHAPKGAV